MAHKTLRETYRAIVDHTADLQKDGATSLDVVRVMTGYIAYAASFQQDPTEAIEECCAKLRDLTFALESLDPGERRTVLQLVYEENGGTERVEDAEGTDDHG